MPKAIRMPPATAPTKRRSSKKLRSSIGYGTCRSKAAKAASASSPTAAATSTRAESQQCSGPAMIAKTTPLMPTVDSNAPGRSGRSPAPLRDSGTMRATATTPISASGTLIRKIAPHQKWLSSGPPISGPAANPSEPTAPHSPMALVRSSSAKTCTTTARVVVINSAPPTPIPARAAINCPGDCAYAATTEPTPNTSNPVTSIFLQPYRSAALPAVSSNPDCTSA